MRQPLPLENSVCMRNRPLVLVVWLAAMLPPTGMVRTPSLRLSNVVTRWLFTAVTPEGLLMVSLAIVWGKAVPVAWAVLPLYT